LHKQNLTHQSWFKTSTKQNLTHQSWFKTSTIKALPEFCLSKSTLKKNTNQPLQNLGMVSIQVNSCAINKIGQRKVDVVSV
jgi:hypothetical protein